MLGSIFNRKPIYYGVKTFTYFIPAPPARKTGYQEKEFDSIVNNIIKMGFEIVKINTSTISHDQNCGMWVVCLIGAKTKEIFDKEVLFDSSDGFSVAQTGHVPLDPDIIHE